MGMAVLCSIQVALSLILKAVCVVLRQQAAQNGSLLLELGDEKSVTIIVWELHAEDGGLVYAVRHLNMYVCMYVCMYACLYVVAPCRRLRACLRGKAPEYVCIYVYVCMYVCMYVW